MFNVLKLNSLNSDDLFHLTADRSNYVLVDRRVVELWFTSYPRDLVIWDECLALKHLAQWVGLKAVLPCHVTTAIAITLPISTHRAVVIYFHVFHLHS